MTIVVMICLAILTSCASPKTSVRVRNNATGSETTINVKNGEGSSTSVSVSPSMTVDSVSFNFKKNQ